MKSNSEERTYTAQQMRTIMEILEAEKKCVRNLRKKITELELLGLKSQRDELKAISIELNELHQDLKLEKEERQEKERELQKTRSLYQSSEKRLVQAQADIESLKIQSSFKETAELRVLKQNLADVRAEKERELQKIHSKHQSSEESLAQAQVEIESLKTEYSSQETAELRVLKQNLADVRAEKERELQKIHSKHQSSEESLVQAQVEIESLKARSLSQETAALCALKQDLADASADIVRLQRELQKGPDQSQKVEDLLVTLTTLRQDQEEDSAHILTLQETKNELQDELFSLRKHAQNLEKGIQYLRENPPKVDEVELNHLKAELNVAAKSSIELETELQELKQRYLQLSDKYHLLETEKGSYLNSLEEREFSLDGLEDELKSKTLELDEVKRAYESTHNTLIEAKQALNTQAELILEQQRSSEEFELRAECAEKKVEDLSLELKRIADERFELKQQVKEREQKLERRSEQYEERSTELMKMTVELKSLQSTLEQKHETFYQQEHELKVAQQHLAKKIKEHAELKAQNEEKRQDLNNQRNRIDTLEQRTEDLKDEYRRKELESSTEKNELVSAKQALERSLLEKENEHKLMNNEVEGLREQVADLKSIEAQYIKLKEKVSELGSIFGSTKIVEPPSPRAEIKEPIREEPKPVSNEVFTLQSSEPRYRNSFFDD